MTKQDNKEKSRAEEIGEKMQNAGKNMQKWGCLLTLLITVPIILTISLGPLGIGISAVLIILVIASKFSKKKE